MTSDKIQVIMLRTNFCNIQIPVSIILCKNTRKLKKVLNRLHKHNKGIDYIWLAVDVINNNFFNILKRLYWLKIVGNNRKILLSNNKHNLKSLRGEINNKYGTNMR